MARLQKAKFEILHAYRLHDDDPDVVAFVEQLMGELKAK
jgi:hypothetical protein